MYLPKNAPRNRLREAQNARNNRAEIVEALSHGQVTRRELIRWGIFTAAGTLALKNGLSPFASSAYAAIPTGVPPTPMFGALPFTQPFNRLNLQTPIPLTGQTVLGKKELAWPAALSQRNCKGESWHTEYSASGGTDYKNPWTGRGPCEGRPPGEFFAHQRWAEYTPKVGYILSLGQIKDGARFHPSMPAQGPNAVWPFGTGGLGTRGTLPPPLIKVRYGEPVAMRVYNSLPVDRTQNGGFGRNEASTHNHNAHNGFISDGANNSYHFPGTFFDYHWGTTLARAEMTNTAATEKRASGPNDGTGLNLVPGDFRELQGTLWFHDHRFFFTAENVYKGHAGMMNYYSGPDRGHERLTDTVNLRLPSGYLLPWGNIDFDINMMISDFATSPDGQLFFDIFDTDGFLGDHLLVNFAYAPFLEVLPRKYRFRILNACMSRFINLAFVNASGKQVPVRVIANDGNFLVNPVTVTQLDIQGVAERFDVIVDFSAFKPGDKLKLVNVLQFKDGRGPDKAVTAAEALGGKSSDPAVGAVMEFRVASSVQSVDVPGVTLTVANSAGSYDKSVVPGVLTEQIPLVTPVRERVIEFTRGGDDPRGANGQCFPGCEGRDSFPWTVKVNGQSAHSLNANRISVLVPRPGEVEHWTLVNGGGGWDHPIHLHFEEGVTIDRQGDSMPLTERLARKDVWRLRAGGKVKFQVRFGEFGGAYVNHCHNTVHEDNAMLLRYQILRNDDGTGNPLVGVTPTPRPTPDGVEFVTPEILPEGDPRRGSA